MREQKSIAKQLFKIKLAEIILFPIRMFPVKRNRVLLISWMGYHYAGNPQYIAEYLEQENNDKIEVLFATKDDVSKLQKEHSKIKFIKFGTLSYFIAALSSKVFVTDGGGVSYIPFKKRQCIINTWHGGGAYKLVGIDALGNTELVKKYVLQDSKKYSMFVSTCKRASQYYHRVKGISLDRFLEVGMPRNDMLIDGNVSRKNVEDIANLIGVEGKKVILYAPTFRDYAENVYDWKMPEIDFSIEKLLKQLANKFSGDWIFLYRGHPNAARQKHINRENVIDVTSYPDMQHLLLLADVLITDYSSSVWDYALTYKPAFLYTPDLQTYKKFRGFEVPIEQWPYDLAMNEDELCNLIQNFSFDNHKKRVDQHFEMMGNCETGKATKLICDEIIKKLIE